MTSLKLHCILNKRKMMLIHMYSFFNFMIFIYINTFSKKIYLCTDPPSQKKIIMILVKYTKLRSYYRLLTPSTSEKIKIVPLAPHPPL